MDTHTTSAGLFKHPFVLTAIGIVVVIAGASAMYYVQSTRIPSIDIASSAATSSSALTATGIVTPAANPDLAFPGSGRVTAVYVHVGDHVTAGQTLASLDTSILSAQRAQAEASVSSAQAHLAELLRGALPQDIAVKQTAIDQASASLQNSYTSGATAATQAYDKAFGGFSQYTDSLFNGPNTTNPTLVFNTINSNLGLSAALSRVTAQGELATWQGEVSAYSPAGATAALSSALSHLNVLRMYSDALIAALGSAVPSTAFPSTSIAAAQTSVSAYRDALNTMILSLQSAQQQITSSQLALQAAQNALAQTTAAATPETIASARAAVDAAQANVMGIEAQIRNDLIIAPFTGTVASVGVKVGDVVAPNTHAVSLTPSTALQIAAYFSELDIAKIHSGDTATVTLDAYGKDRTFPASVVSVDAAPSTAPSGSSGYKATLQFSQPDPAITAGMTANITISQTH